MAPLVDVQPRGAQGGSDSTGSHPGCVKYAGLRWGLRGGRHIGSCDLGG